MRIYTGYTRRRLIVVLTSRFSLFSTRRPRGAPFPRAMRGFVSQILPPCQRFHAASTQRAKNTCHAWKGYHFYVFPTPPECVYPTQRSRKGPTRFNEAHACIVPCVTLGPRVYCPAPTRTRE